MADYQLIGDAFGTSSTFLHNTRFDLLTPPFSSSIRVSFGLPAGQLVSAERESAWAAEPGHAARLGAARPAIPLAAHAEARLPADGPAHVPQDAPGRLSGLSGHRNASLRGGSGILCHQVTVFAELRLRNAPHLAHGLVRPVDGSATAPSATSPRCQPVAGLRLRPAPESDESVSRSTNAHAQSAARRTAASPLDAFAVRLHLRLNGADGLLLPHRRQLGE